ncbi:MAG: tRNA (adenosine(37)-N6)-dimethylallyltransferase MiaA [Candidatus Acidiferrales bacterium]
MRALARLVVVLGPTASGKSALGIRLAQKFGGEIVVCDSTQVYRHFDIGTAKVPFTERQGIPHHLVDLVEPQEIFTAGDYRRHARTVLGKIRSRGKLPILTAGTGLYLRALLEGLADAPIRSEELRERLRRKAELHGSAHLHRILSRLDPTAAARIAPRDAQKVIRAIEMRVLTGKPVGEIHGGGRIALEGFEVKKIGLIPPRAALYARIESRIDAMLAAGWLDEVRQLVAHGIAPDAKPFQFIGYAELRAHLSGEFGSEEAKRKIQQATRRFAKRQITWFRKEPGVHWVPEFGDEPSALALASEFLQSETR